MATSSPEIVYFASQRPRFTLNKFLCEPLSLCTQRSLSALNQSLRKGAPSVSNFSWKCRQIRVAMRKKARIRPLLIKKTCIIFQFLTKDHGYRADLCPKTRNLLRTHEVLHNSPLRKGKIKTGVVTPSKI